MQALNDYIRAHRRRTDGINSQMEFFEKQAKAIRE